jgi:hypothetical protein
MRWGKMIEKWLGHSNEKGELMRSDEVSLLSECHTERVEKVCHDLGETEDRETIEMLMEDGLDDDAIEEVVKARNILSSNVIGDLDLEVEKMFAEGTLHRYGFDCIEEIDDKVTVYREHHVSMK